MPSPSYQVHGYAIVSDDGMIAGADGNMPAALRNDADWAYFQSQLDRSQLVLVGRRSHAAAPSTGRRRRVVVSRSAVSLALRGHAWWWNPEAVAFGAMLSQLLPEGGRIAVPGGQGVFDLLGEWRAFDQFHLTRVQGVNLPGGLPAFSAQARVGSVENVLAAQGLHPGPEVTLDAAGHVVLSVWQRIDGAVRVD